MTYTLADLAHAAALFTETVWPAPPTLDGFLAWLGHCALESADDAVPRVLDAGPCPDCSAEIIWTVQGDPVSSTGQAVRTAWSGHQCPRSGGRPL